ncbi:hypothetical protein CC80DRAFT_515346 [Byssothecium circinans]|uniref:DUF8035 domain-containing protein n=1 Tax=Byssothecium circinans TaxID=147558 RepID=A0A6A5U1M6_9PLEO|nr:hypothetical protein CC80DRAFT_515346 [Byssothecium circinans]
MMTSIVLPLNPTYKTPTLRRYSYTKEAPPLPPRPNRRNTTTTPALQLQTITQSVGMSSRYTRPASPRGRYTNPARSSTGTFDPYYDSTYYGRPSSPRLSGERLYPQHTYAPSNSVSSRTSSLKYDSYLGRSRRNTLTESDDRSIWPNSGLAPSAVLPSRSHALHAHHERPSSPLARSRDNRGDTYITHGAPHRREHKRIYSVDDGSHTAKLVAEKDTIEPRSGRTYHQHESSLPSRDVGDDGYSYTDPASMYRDTEPAWRRPRSGSVERSLRPTSLIVDRAPRSSARDLGPPPSTRGFGKINSGVSNNNNNNSSRHHGRSPSLERGRDTSKYDTYPQALPPRPSSNVYHAPAVHQDIRRDSHLSDYPRPDRDVENRRYTTDQFDPDVAKRGFGIASPIAAQEPSYDRQAPWNVPEPPRSRPTEYGKQYYPTDRAEARMPEPRIPRERDVVPTYDERPRERDRDRHDSSHISSSTVPIVASAATGAAATLGAAGLLKSRNKDRDSERERELEKEREQRREWDERDRRDRITDERRDERRERAPEERRDRAVEERRNRAPEERRERALEDRPRDRAPEERLAPVVAAYASTQESDRRPRDRQYEDDRDRRSRKQASSEDSGDERPRHYVDPSAARESERRRDAVPKEASIDPDEEYRRRIQQEAERSGRNRDQGDSDKERERLRRRDEREKSRDRTDDARSHGPPSTIAEPPRSRFEERPSHVLDTDIVQEPDSITKEQPSRSVQIVTPPKEPAPQPKGILRKPTEKFPEEPEPIREGVAPHKSQMKGNDIPVNARWTKIDRKLVNPEALEAAKERFEERLDCVIVLRVLTKQEIQKLADRTRAIREAREDEYERRDYHDDHHDRDRDRDRRSRRSHRDEDDRDRRRDYDDSGEEDIGRDRERDRPRATEDGR